MSQQMGECAFFIIDNSFSRLSFIIVMFHIQSNFAVGPEVRKWLA